MNDLYLSTEQTKLHSKSSAGNDPIGNPHALDDKVNSWLDMIGKKYSPQLEQSLREKFANPIYSQLDSYRITDYQTLQNFIKDPKNNVSALLSPEMYSVYGIDHQELSDLLVNDFHFPASAVPDKPTPPPVGGLDVQAMTFNIRTSDAPDKGNHSWSDRLQAVADTINGTSTDDNGKLVGSNDFVALQEASGLQVNDLRNKLDPKFQIVQTVDGQPSVMAGTPGQEQIGASNENAIVVNTQKWSVMSKGYYRIHMDQMDKDHNWPRTVGYVVCKNKQTGQKILVCSTHAAYSVGFNKGDAAFTTQALAKIRAENGLSKNSPTVFMGDFNNVMASKSQDSRAQREKTLEDDNGLKNVIEVPNGGVVPVDDKTYNGWNPNGAAQMDNIYENADTSHAEILHNRNGIDGVPFASDHWALESHLHWNLASANRA